MKNKLNWNVKLVNNIQNNILKAKLAGKSFDEWINELWDTIYHGTNYENFEFEKSISKNWLYGKWVYFASNKNIAKQYGNKIIEVILDKESLLKIDEPLTNTQKVNLRKVMVIDEWNWDKNPTWEFVWQRLELTKKNPEELLKKAGIKWIQHKQFVEEGININYILFDNNAIKNKDELELEWNNTNWLN